MTPFRIGLYGCGRRTQAILERALASGTACVTRCHDINQKSAEELAAKYNAKTATLDELLSAEDVDMLLISLFLDRFMELTLTAAAFKGIKLAVGVLILDAGITMLRKMHKKPFPLTIMSLSFTAMLLIDLFSWNFSSISLMLVAAAISLTLFLVKGAPDGKGGAAK